MRKGSGDPAAASATQQMVAPDYSVINQGQQPEVFSSGPDPVDEESTGLKAKAACCASPRKSTTANLKMTKPNETIVNHEND